ncbi:MAG: hypothetical protein WC113_03875 [Candidatus Paceibacterota bacterium]|jgi:hypothetical protein
MQFIVSGTIFISAASFEEAAKKGLNGLVKAFEEAKRITGRGGNKEKVVVVTDVDSKETQVFQF